MTFLLIDRATNVYGSFEVISRVYHAVRGVVLHALVCETTVHRTKRGGGEVAACAQTDRVNLGRQALHILQMEIWHICR